MDSVRGLPVLRLLGTKRLCGRHNPPPKLTMLRKIRTAFRCFSRTRILHKCGSICSLLSHYCYYSTRAAVNHLRRIVTCHSAIPVDEVSPGAYFVRLQSLDLRSCVLFKTRASSIEQSNQDHELDTILQEEHNTDFKPSRDALPFWRLTILQDAVEEKGCGFTASFVFHHSLGDGATGVIFHQSFHQALESALMLPSLEPNSSTIRVSESSTLLPPL
jgi:hypothetical protein